MVNNQQDEFFAKEYDVEDGDFLFLKHPQTPVFWGLFLHISLTISHMSFSLYLSYQVFLFSIHSYTGDYKNIAGLHVVETTLQNIIILNASNT